jgi:hypothetical protein
MSDHLGGQGMPVSFAEVARRLQRALPALRLDQVEQILTLTKASRPPG